MDGGNAAHKTSAALNVLGVLASFSLGFRVGLFVRSVDVDDDDEYERDDEEGSLHLEEVRSAQRKATVGGKPSFLIRPSGPRRRVEWHDRALALSCDLMP